MWKKFSDLKMFNEDTESSHSDIETISKSKFEKKSEMSWKWLSAFITRVRGQYRYSRCLLDVIGWKLRHRGQYSPVLSAAIVTTGLFKYISIKCKQTQKNFRNIYHTLSISVFIFRLQKTWRCYSEDITGRWRDKDIAVS